MIFLKLCVCVDSVTLKITRNWLLLRYDYEPFSSRRCYPHTVKLIQSCDKLKLVSTLSKSFVGTRANTYSSIFFTRKKKGIPRTNNGIHAFTSIWIPCTLLLSVVYPQ